MRAAGNPGIVIKTPMAPPQWALLERELLRANSRAAEQFYARYVDERGYLAKQAGRDRVVAAGPPAADLRQAG